MTSSRRSVENEIRTNPFAILSILARRETGFDCRATLKRGLLAAAAVNDTRTPHPLSSLHAARPSDRDYAIYPFDRRIPTPRRGAAGRLITNPRERHRNTQRACARLLYPRRMNLYANRSFDLSYVRFP